MPGAQSNFYSVQLALRTRETPHVRITFSLTWGLTPIFTYLGIRTRTFPHLRIRTQTFPHLGMMSPNSRTRGLWRFKTKGGAGINAAGPRINEAVGEWYCTSLASSLCLQCDARGYLSYTMVRWNCFGCRPAQILGCGKEHLVNP